MIVLPAAAAGAGTALGLLVTISGLRPASHLPADATPSLSRTHQLRRVMAQPRGRVTLAVIVGALTWLLSGWFITGVLATAAVAAVPHLVQLERTANNAITRLDACAEWTRALAGRLSVGMSLEQAIIASDTTAPSPVATDVGRLAGRLRNGWPVSDALDALAEDLNDSTGDLVAAGLKVSAQCRGTGLARVLRELADSIAEEVTGRRRIEADRAKPRTTARLVSLLAIGTFLGLQFSSSYMAPYRSPGGQFVLAAIAALFATAVAWMYRLARTTPEPRFLETRSPVGSTGDPR